MNAEVGPTDKPTTDEALLQRAGIHLTWAAGMWIAETPRHGCWGSGVTIDQAIAELTVVLRDYEVTFEAISPVGGGQRDNTE